MIYEKRTGVPSFVSFEYRKKLKNYVVLIPIINEGIRIRQELIRAKNNNISEFADIVICDGGSTDGSTDEENLRTLDVNTLLVKKGFREARRTVTYGLLVGTRTRIRGNYHN